MDANNKTSQEYAIDFIRAFADTEAEILPFKEHLKDLKKNYVENGWLTKEEVRLAVRAYRMLKQDEDIAQLATFYDKLSETV
tara:strand:+ start:511 stop:756 length:246 start_codon:yes stop_codon:yes gene_type:complete